MPSRTAISIAAGVVLFALLVSAWLAQVGSSSDHLSPEQRDAVENSVSASPGPTMPRADVTASAPSPPQTLLIASDDAVRTAINRLFNAGLIQQALSAAAILKQSTPVTGSPLEAAHLRLLADPSKQNYKDLYATSYDTLIRRHLQREPEPDPTTSAELSSRQIMLQLLVDAQYTIASGKIDQGEQDRILWELSVALAVPSIQDLRPVYETLVDQRLAAARASITQWAQQDLSTLSDSGPDAASRHWIRALTEVRMRDAAERGDQYTLERLAADFLSIPYGGNQRERQVLNKYSRTLVAEARATARVQSSTESD